MKLLFKTICALLIFQSAFAKDVVLITFHGNLKKAELAQKIIIERFEIPKRLIRLKKEKAPCAGTHEAIFHFCINKRNDLMTLKKNHQFYLRNLKVFRKDRLTYLGE